MFGGDAQTRMSGSTPVAEEQIPTSKWPMLVPSMCRYCGAESQ